MQTFLLLAGVALFQIYVIFFTNIFLLLLQQWREALGRSSAGRQRWRRASF